MQLRWLERQTCAQKYVSAGSSTSHYRKQTFLQFAMTCWGTPVLLCQVLMARKQWDASEEALSSALAAAEAAGGERSPLLAPVLLLLGYGYARSARVMFAEGMLREAAKLVGGTEPAR